MTNHRLGVVRAGDFVYLRDQRGQGVIYRAYVDDGGAIALRFHALGAHAKGGPS